ncbi:MAG: hypothetical protein ABSE28_06585 [Candidatus Sulfotelmatobacter sp.]
MIGCKSPGVVPDEGAELRTGSITPYPYAKSTKITGRPLDFAAPVEATNKLLRYEAHLDRQLYRAMDQLERLQRQRRGEKVPPPLNINLGRRN